MAKDDESAAATKQDVQMLMEQIGEYYIGTEEKMFKLEQKILESEDRMKRHFDLSVETIRHDLKGANRDEINVLKDRSQSHDERITHLERHAGIVR